MSYIVVGKRMYTLEQAGKRIKELEAREPLLIERELLIIDKLASEFKGLQAVVDRLANDEWDEENYSYKHELELRIKYAKQHATKEDDDNE